MITSYLMLLSLFPLLTWQHVLGTLFTFCTILLQTPTHFLSRLFPAWFVLLKRGTAAAANLALAVLLFLNVIFLLSWSGWDVQWRPLTLCFFPHTSALSAVCLCLRLCARLATRLRRHAPTLAAGGLPGDVCPPREPACQCARYVSAWAHTQTPFSLLNSVAGDVPWPRA